MQLMDRTPSDVRDSLRRRRLDAKVRSAEVGSEALRSENRVLREQLMREHSALEMALTPRRKPHRIRRLATLGVAAAGAYVAGTKAGRERYDQLRTWISRKAPDLDLDEPDAIRQEAAAAVADAGARMGRNAERVGESMRQSAFRAGEAAKETAERAGEALGEGASQTARKMAGGQQGRSLS
jgi:hypothetical protein